MNRTFLKYGKWVVGVAAAASVSVAVTHCSSPSASPWTPPKSSNVPDTYSKWDYNWDKREPNSLLKPPKGSKSAEGSEGYDEILEKRKPKAIRHLILIRHGHYNYGQNDKERYLTSLGEQQAELTGIRLKNSGIDFHSIVSSNLTRAIQTAEIVLKQLGRPDLEIKRQDPMLKEGAPVIPDPPVKINWEPEPYEYYEHGARMEAAFRKYFHRADPDQEKDSYEIIVCHGNVIRYFTCRALQFPGEAWLRMSLNNCTLTVITIYPSGRVILRALGDSGHLPVDKIST